jgi:hypothetical protein
VASRFLATRGPWPFKNRSHDIIAASAAASREWGVDATARRRGVAGAGFTLPILLNVMRALVG